MSRIPSSWSTSALSIGPSQRARQKFGRTPQITGSLLNAGPLPLTSCASHRKECGATRLSFPSRAASRGQLADGPAKGSARILCQRPFGLRTRRRGFSCRAPRRGSTAIRRASGKSSLLLIISSAPHLACLREGRVSSARAGSANWLCKTSGGPRRPSRTQLAVESRKIMRAAHLVMQ